MIFSKALKISIIFPIETYFESAAAENLVVLLGLPI